MDKILKKDIKNASGKQDLYRAPRIAIEDAYKNPCKSGCDRNLNVAVVASPCHGFGDVIFATKFARYLKHGFKKGSTPLSKRVSIVTPTPEMFKKLGVNDIKIVPLKSKSKVAQCRRLRAYPRPQGAKAPFDLIFIAPLMNSFNINYADVKALFKESTPFNTIFLSEYQDNPRKDFDILTGVGSDYDGILFDDQKPNRKLKTLGRHPYALAYLAKDAGIDTCLQNFVKMVIAKYKNKNTLQIVVPQWAAKELATDKNFLKFAKKYFPIILVQMSDQTKVLEGENTPRGKKLIIRGDVLPVSRPDMLSLMKHSLPDILVTGDQSITDVIGCCNRKTVWYQTVPWKISLAKALAKEMPQKYLRNERTSCGTLKGFKVDSNLKRFKSQHDFRKKARPTIEAAFRAASEAKKKGSLINQYLNKLDKTSSKKQLLELFD